MRGPTGAAIETWSFVPSRVAFVADDRISPLEFQRTLVRDRLGLEARVLPGGHLIALARPLELTDYLLNI